MRKALRRGGCLLLILILCCSLFPIAGAAKSVVLTAVNDSFLPLSSSTMPTRQNGEYYVPYSVFGSRLGVRSTQRDSTLSLTAGNTTLTFNVAAGTVYDQNMNSYSSPAYQINGTIYVPARLVCGRFGYSYSTLQSGDTLILRICSSSASLSDSEFLSSSGSTIRSMLNAYNGVSSPSTPGQTHTETTRKPSSIGFAVYGASNESTSSILDALNVVSHRAVFFLPVDLNGYSNELLRQIAAAGHGFGFSVPLDAVPDAEALAQANQHLFDITGMTTRLLFIESSASELTAEQRDMLTGAGFRLWDATHAISSDATASRTITNLTNDFSKTSSAVVLGIPHADASAKVIQDISSYMGTNAIPELDIKLLTQPINHANDRR